MRLQDASASVCLGGEGEDIREGQNEKSYIIEY